MPSDKQTQRQTLRARGICTIIPTYNNGGTIGDVVRQTLVECDDVIVVDDGCTDNTADVLAQIPGITVVRHEKNRGKGAGLKSGFAKAKEMGFSYAITLDGDGQHYPRDIARMLSANQKYPGAIIIGKRDLTNAERSGGSKFANAFSNFWFNVQTGRFLTDTQSGFRLYPLNKLRLLPFVSARYEAELSLLVFASWFGAEIRETTIDVYYPPANERVSHFRPAADFTRISILNTFLTAFAVLFGLPLFVTRMTVKLLRTVYSLVVFAVSLTLIFTPAVWLYKTFGSGRPEWVLRLMHKVSRFVMLSKFGIPGIKFKVTADAGVDFTKPSIIVCNHISSLDMLCKLCMAPNIVFLTKDWVRRNPFFGFIVRSAGYPSSTEGIETLLPELQKLMAQGNSIVIYPEGTRSKDGTIGRFHQGAFVLAERLGASITPAVVYGTNRVVSRSSLWIMNWPVELHFGTPITPAELQSIGSTLQQASELRKRTRQVYTDMANRIERDV